jgi:hypothetical protein
MSNQQTQGFSILLSVIVIGSLVGVLVVTTYLSNITAINTVGETRDTLRAMSYADACAEEALQQIKSQPNYAGSGSISFDEGSCENEVRKNGGQKRTVETTGTVGDTVRRSKISIDSVRPTISVTSWQEVSEF